MKIAQYPSIRSAPSATAPTPVIQSQPQTLATVHVNKTAYQVGLYGPHPTSFNHQSNADNKEIALSLLRFFSTQIAEQVVPHHGKLAMNVVKSIWIGFDLMKYRAELRTAHGNRIVNSLKGAGLTLEVAEVVAAAFNVHGFDPLVANVRFGLDQVHNGLTGQAVFDPMDLQKWALQLQGEGVNGELIDVLQTVSTKWRGGGSGG
jgi:hypothetical protein